MTAPLLPLPDALSALRDQLAAVPLGLATPDRDAAWRAARGVVDQIDDYLLPRLRDLDAPLLTVVGGSTGAGKSTLVNSLVGAPVTTSGVLRPTTRSPVLVCAAADVAAFSGDRVLPHLPRVTGGPGGPGTVQLVVRDDLPAGLALLDAPDVDSVVESNRDLAGQLLAAADLWVFVTTAARYADAVPWDLLRTAQERGTALAVVLDRVPPEATAEVAADLAGMLQRAGLAARAPVRHRGAPAARGRAAARGAGRAAAGLAARAGRRPGGPGRRRPADADRRAGQPDRARGATSPSRSRRRTPRPPRCTRPRRPPTTRPAPGSTTASGTAPCCGARCWPGGRSSSARASGCARCRTGSGRVRDRVAGALTGRPAPAVQVQGAVENSVERLLRAEADHAAERTVTAWRALPGGAALVAGAERELEQVSPDFPEVAAAQVRDWQGGVLDLVRSEGADKRTQARALSWGVNGAGAAVMVGGVRADRWSDRRRRSRWPAAPPPSASG